MFIKKPEKIFKYEIKTKKHKFEKKYILIIDYIR